MNKFAIILVGLPALGKSTRVAEIQKQYPQVFVYSTDNYIVNVAKWNNTTYDQEWAKHNKAALEFANAGLNDAITAGQSVVFDQTNLSAKKRKSIITRMKQAGYTVRVEVFVPPFTHEEEQVWKMRLSSRVGKTIPSNVLAGMMESYVEPTPEEGFDELILIRNLI